MSAIVFFSIPLAQQLSFNSHAVPPPPRHVSSWVLVPARFLYNRECEQGGRARGGVGGRDSGQRKGDGAGEREGNGAGDNGQKKGEGKGRGYMNGQGGTGAWHVAPPRQ